MSTEEKLLEVLEDLTDIQGALETQTQLLAEATETALGLITNDMIFTNEDFSGAIAEDIAGEDIQIIYEILLDATISGIELMRYGPYGRRADKELIGWYFDNDPPGTDDDGSKYSWMLHNGKNIPVYISPPYTNQDVAILASTSSSDLFASEEEYGWVSMSYWLYNVLYWLGGGFWRGVPLEDEDKKLGSDLGFLVKKLGSWGVINNISTVTYKLMIESEGYSVDDDLPDAATIDFVEVALFRAIKEAYELENGDSE